MKKFKKRAFFVAFFSAFLLVFYVAINAVPAQDEKDIIQRVRAAIAARGADWQAGETSMTALSKGERQKRLGALIPEIENPKKMIYSGPLVSTPVKMDWRNQMGENFISSVKNQASCGSCWAFAIVAIMEAMYNRILNLIFPSSSWFPVPMPVIVRGGIPMRLPIILRKMVLPGKSFYPMRLPMPPVILTQTGSIRYTQLKTGDLSPRESKIGKPSTMPFKMGRFLFIWLSILIFTAINPESTNIHSVKLKVVMPYCWWDMIRVVITGFARIPGVRTGEKTDILKSRWVNVNPEPGWLQPGELFPLHFILRPM